MLNALVSERARRLIDVKFDERRKLFPVDISHIKHKFQFAYGGSEMIQAIATLHCREVEIRSIIAWESIVRTHQSQGAVFSAELRNYLKQELNPYILQVVNPNVALNLTVSQKFFF